MRRLALAITITLFLSNCAQFAGQGSRGQAVVVTPNASDVLSISVPALRLQDYATPVARTRDITTWQTSNKIGFSFEDGVIVSTRGLGNDLMGADVTQSISATRGGAKTWVPRINGYIDGEYQSYFMAFQCRKTGRVSEQITLGDRRISSTLTTETCVNDERQIENHYWRNSNGLMLKSRQWISPAVGYMETERIIR